MVRRQEVRNRFGIAFLDLIGTAEIVWGVFGRELVILLSHVFDRGR
jgi:hypothetical protein